MYQIGVASLWEFHYIQAGARPQLSRFVRVKARHHPLARYLLRHFTEVHLNSHKQIHRAFFRSVVGERKRENDTIVGVEANLTLHLRNWIDPKTS